MEVEYKEIILSNQERIFLSQFPEEINREEIIVNYDYSEEDLNLIMIRRREHNKLGFALQLGVLRHTGKTLNSFDKIPEIIISYVSMKLGIDETIFPAYYSRENTILEHLDEIRKIYGYSNFDDNAIVKIEKLLGTLMFKSEDPVQLIQQSMFALKREKIIIPRITTLEKIVAKCLIENDERVFSQIVYTLSDSQKKQLEEFLVLKENETITKLEWLKENTGNSNAEEFLLTSQKLKEINLLNIRLNLEGISYLKIESIIRIGKRYDSYSLRRFYDNKKYSIMVLLLNDIKKTLIDKSVTIHDIRMNSIFSKVRRKQEKEIQKKSAAIKDTVNDYILLGKTLLKAKTENKDISKVIEESITWDKMHQSIDNIMVPFVKTYFFKY